MAARDFPESYKDTTYASVDARTEQKLGLPAGLLSNIRERGERSNHSQVSEAGASTVYQFIPATKKAILDKYGIDVTLSPENASEGAGLLLKEGLKRNGGDPAQAVGEYIGGIDRKNWGGTTKAYINRVMTGLRGSGATPAPADPGTAPARAPAQGGSTFDRVMASMPPQQGVSGPQIAQVFQAYQTGQMSPEEAAEFEGDVKSGAVMLPRGATLKSGPTPAAPAAGAAAVELPQAVADAYRLGQMPEAERAELDRDLASGMVKWPGGAAQAQGVAIPPAVPAGTVTPAATAQMAPTRDTGILENVVGAGETALSLGTGMTGGAIGAAGGTALGLVEAIRSGQFGTQQAADLVEQYASKGQQALTYAPRTDAGQQQAESVGTAMQAMAPVAGLTGEMGALASATKPITQAPRAALARVGQQVAEAVPAPVANAARAGVDAAKAGAAAVTGPISSVTGKVRAALGPSKPAEAAGRSVGAAETGAANMRRANAQELPVPIDLTEGQARRDQGMQQFERETAKNPELGAPLRERFEQQNEQLLQNFDSFVDQAGGRSTSLREVGSAVDSALVKQFEADKSKVRAAYKAAEKAGEMEAPVSTAPVVKFLEDNAALDAPELAPVLAVARRELQRLGGSEDGGALSLKDMEVLRKQVNSAIDANMQNLTNKRVGVLLKQAIDDQTEGLGGQLYKEARATRRRMAENYENRSVINKLLSKKGSTDDRAVALEDVFSHTILDGSLDDVRNVRRVLQRGGDEGQQAWRELQSQTLTHMRDEMTKNVARDSKGNAVVSAPALDKVIKKLDVDGKLDFVFGKKGAEQLRVLNDVAKDVLVSNPGAVNHSNTASVLLAALDMGMSGAVGLPLPVASGLRMLTNQIKNKRLAERVKETLGPSADKATTKF